MLDLIPELARVVHQLDAQCHRAVGMCGAAQAGIVCSNHGFNSIQPQVREPLAAQEMLRDLENRAVHRKPVGLVAMIRFAHWIRPCSSIR